jgi:small subunit ribosomal protein S9
MADKIVNISGKRKMSIARATIREGKGDLRINLVPLAVYAPRYSRMRIEETLRVARDFVDLSKLDISVVSEGGGVFGQADAISSSIARGLCEWAESDGLKSAYLAYDRTLLAGDHRLTEPHKPSQSSKGPRHRRQKSYR